MRRALEHPLAPALGCALVCVGYLIASPATADMAAHTYRAWLFQQQGLTVWNAQWYGGHHVLGYSLLFAPLAAAIGPAKVGVLAAIAAVALFTPLARAAAPNPTQGAVAAWLFTAGGVRNGAPRGVAFLPRVAAGGGEGAVAAWLFTAGVLSNVAIGRMPFLLGIAAGVAAWAAARAQKRALSGVLGLATMLASPVAGVFVMLGAVAKLIADGRDGLKAA